jgi:hypothetical protein
MGEILEGLPGLGSVARGKRDVRSLYSTLRPKSRPNGEGSDRAVHPVQETRTRYERLERLVLTSLQGIANRAEASISEEPGAGIPHAGICEGAVG